MIKYVILGFLSAIAIFVILRVGGVMDVEPYYLQVLIAVGAGAALGLLYGVTTVVSRKMKRSESSG